MVEWEIECGPHLEFYQGLAAETGEVPAPLASRPALEPHLDPVWTAFWDLQGERGVYPSGMVRALPWTAAERWAERHGFASPDDFEWLWDRISGLDRAYLSAEAERFARETKRG